MKPAPPNPRYRMPAEWEPHASTWLAWPHYRGDWPGKFEPIPGSTPKSSATWAGTSAST